MNTATLARPGTARESLGLRTFMRRLLRLDVASAGPAVRRLDKGGMDWIAHPRGRTVSCEAGTLWLTFDNEVDDVVLEAGESHRCAKDSKLAIHALADARVSVA